MIFSQPRVTRERHHLFLNPHRGYFFPLISKESEEEGGERGGREGRKVGRERKRETSTGCLLNSFRPELRNPQLRHVPLTGNRACDPSVHGLVLQPLSQTCQGKSHYLITPSAVVPAKPVLSPRLLFGHRTIVLSDLIILGRWSKLSNQRLCGIMVKGTDYGAKIAGVQSLDMPLSSHVMVTKLLKLSVHISLSAKYYMYVSHRVVVRIK